MLSNEPLQLSQAEMAIVSQLRVVDSEDFEFLARFINCRYAAAQAEKAKRPDLKLVVSNQHPQRTPGT